MPELAQLSSLKGFPAFVKTGRIPGEMSAEIDGWSTDLIVRLTLAIEQEFGGLCPVTGRLATLAESLKDRYLAKVGVASARLASVDRRRLFRGLLALKDQVPAVKQRASAVAFKPPAIPYLNRVFGSAVESRGILIIGGKKSSGLALESLVKRLCANRNPCLFWNALALYKVVLTEESGVAAYVSELGILVLSEALVVDPTNRLHEVVLIHELAHVAERTALLMRDEKWGEEFRVFSGWREKDGKWGATVDEQKTEWNDTLTQLSEKSPFSLVPDPVTLGATIDGRRLDGFVFAKGYRDSVARNDPAEDLADHVAAYFSAPTRYCHAGTPVAPGKWNWVKKRVFGGGGGGTKLPCRPGG